MIAGTIYYRREHAGEQLTTEFSGPVVELADELASLGMGFNCDCCLPEFITPEGFAAEYVGDRLCWSLKAWGGARLGLTVYQARYLGETEPMP